MTAAYGKSPEGSRQHHSGVLTHPPDPAHTRYNQLFDELITRRGGDANIGLKLPELLRQAGLGEVGRGSCSRRS